MPGYAPVNTRYLRMKTLNDQIDSAELKEKTMHIVALLGSPNVKSRSSALAEYLLGELAKPGCGNVALTVWKVRCQQPAAG